VKFHLLHFYRYDSSITLLTNELLHCVNCIDCTC